MGKRLLVTLATAAASALALARAAAVDPGSQLIACDQADTPVTIAVSSHLDPSCTWTRGVEIIASNVVLDCQGAHIATTDRRTGIMITSTVDVALSSITVRNCYVEGFLNNVRITREGFRDLAEGVEYDHAFSDILIEDSTFPNSRGVGIFVDGYVTDVTLRNLHVEGASEIASALARDGTVRQHARGQVILGAPDGQRSQRDEPDSSPPRESRRVGGDRRADQVSAMTILRVYESWIHTHFITDGQRLPTDRVRQIERAITPTLRELGIVFGIHLERERSDPGIRVVLECRPNARELTLIRRRLAEIIAPIPRRPPTTVVRVADSETPSGNRPPRA